MAEIRPLKAIHYAPDVTLDDVVAPPYDVIDDEQRAALLARSPHNVVEIDLPQGDEPYEHAAKTFEEWLGQGVLVRDEAPALWVLTQEYTDPDGERRIRSGFFAAVRVTGYGPGRIRPHERTHPGPKEDRLRLTRATRGIAKVDWPLPPKSVPTSSNTALFCAIARNCPRAGSQPLTSVLPTAQ